MVVETIDFYQDEDAELPPPMTQRDVIILNKAGLEDEEPAAEEDGDAAGNGKVCFIPLLGCPPAVEKHLPSQAPISLGQDLEPCDAIASFLGELSGYKEYERGTG